MRASFLPGTRASVRDKLDQLSMHRIDLAAGAVLEGLRLHHADSAFRWDVSARAGPTAGAGCSGGSHPELSAHSARPGCSYMDCLGRNNPP